MRRAARIVLNVIDAKASADAEYAAARFIPTREQFDKAEEAAQAPRVALTAEQAAQVRTIQQVQDYGIERDRGPIDTNAARAAMGLPEYTERRYGPHLYGVESKRASSALTLNVFEALAHSAARITVAVEDVEAIRDAADNRNGVVYDPKPLPSDIAVRQARGRGYGETGGSVHYDPYHIRGTVTE
jgi:hypothetical protein